MNNIAFKHPQLNDLFGDNQGIKPGEFWLVSSIPRFTAAETLSSLMVSLPQELTNVANYEVGLEPVQFVEDVLNDAPFGSDIKVVGLTGLQHLPRSTVRNITRLLRAEFAKEQIAVLAYLPLDESILQLEKENPILWPTRVFGHNYYAAEPGIVFEADGELLVCPDILGTSVFRGKHRGIDNGETRARISYI